VVPSHVDGLHLSSMTNHPISHRSGQGARAGRPVITAWPTNICIWAGETHDLSCTVSVFIGIGVAKVFGQAHLGMAYSLGLGQTSVRPLGCGQSRISEYDSRVRRRDPEADICAQFLQRAYSCISPQELRRVPSFQKVFCRACRSSDRFSCVRDHQSSRRIS